MEKQGYEIVIKAQARIDILNHYTYYAENYSVRYAERFFKWFYKAGRNYLTAYMDKS